jgi:transcriptional regulator with XRE-family HTH domain
MNSKILTFEEIKSRLASRDIQFADIAAAFNVSASSVTQTAKGSPSFKLATAISNSLGLPINQVFGDKYNKGMKRGPKPRIARRKAICKSLQENKYVEPPQEMEGKS